MNEQDYFSSNHNRLLTIATWAKYLAWIVLAFYLILAVLQFFQYQNFLNSSGQLPTDIWDYFKNNPFDAFRLAVNILISILRGVIFYLVLKGLSLGLNMIVETDINYREQKAGIDEQPAA